MAKFRKKPVIIDAVQLKDRCEIKTMEGKLYGEIGDWLIIGVEGEKYPCGDAIFRKTYEPVDSEAEAIFYVR